MQLISLKCSLGLATLIFATTVACASPIIVDFTGVDTDSLQTTSFVSKGVRFTPNCHQHILNQEGDELQYDVPARGGNWLGFDPSGCSSIFNPNYSGPNVGLDGKLLVNLASGQAFNFLSFNYVRAVGGPQEMYIHSSRGGFMEIRRDGPEPFPFFLSGAEWRNLDWLVFSQTESSSSAGIDNLTLERVVGQVPEPGSTAAWLALLSALAVLRPRRA